MAVVQSVSSSLPFALSVRMIFIVHSPVSGLLATGQVRPVSSIR